MKEGERERGGEGRKEKGRKGQGEGNKRKGRKNWQREGDLMAPFTMWEYLQVIELSCNLRRVPLHSHRSRQLVFTFVQPAVKTIMKRLQK